MLALLRIARRRFPVSSRASSDNKLSRLYKELAKENKDTPGAKSFEAFSKLPLREKEAYFKLIRNALRGVLSSLKSIPRSNESLEITTSYAAARDLADWILYSPDASRRAIAVASLQKAAELFELGTFFAFPAYDLVLGYTYELGGDTALAAATYRHVLDHPGYKEALGAAAEILERRTLLLDSTK